MATAGGAGSVPPARGAVAPLNGERSYLLAISFLRQIRQAVEQLNPNELRAAAERRVIVELSAASLADYARIEQFLAPASVSDNRRRQALQYVYRGEEGNTQPDLRIVAAGQPAPAGAFIFDPYAPEMLVQQVVTARDDLALALARAFPPFRQAVVDKTVFAVSKENALFALATAVPDILPGLSLPWALPQAASDTAILTVNQIRMAFLLAAASDRPVGYSEQRTEIGGIIAGAFGWRALARELIGKIPAGGGLIPKAGIAFAATFVEGLSLDRLYRVGYGYTRHERQEAYGAALERGKQVAAVLWERIRPRQG